MSRLTGNDNLRSCPLFHCPIGSAMISWISAQMLKAVVTDMFTGAAIPPEAILKAVSFANLSALMLP